jgi:hypothetical protein
MKTLLTLGLNTDTIIFLTIFGIIYTTLVIFIILELRALKKDTRLIKRIFSTQPEIYI